MKYALSVLIFFLGASVSFGATSESTYDSYNNAAYASLGFWEGGIAFGGDYEYAYDRIFGLGATARFYSKDSNSNGSGRSSLFVLGGFIRPHFNRREWDFYVSPGFNLMIIDGPNDDDTVLGPSINYGLLYQIKRNVAVGVENSIFAGWFNNDYRGVLYLDLLGKARFSF